MESSWSIPCTLHPAGSPDALAKIAVIHRFLVNTHLHGDHTAGNEAMAKIGAVIISQENMRTRLAAKPNTPPAALPVITYTDNLTLHFNGEEIYIYHPARPRTDSDSIIYFMPTSCTWATCRRRYVIPTSTASGRQLHQQDDHQQHAG